MKRKFSLTALIIAFVITSAIYIQPDIMVDKVEAGAIGSVGSGGTGNTSAIYGKFQTPFIWMVKRNLNKNYTIKDSHYPPYYTRDVDEGSSVAYLSMGTYHVKGSRVPFPNDWYRWEYWINNRQNFGPPDLPKNHGLWNKGMLLPQDFIQEALDEGYQERLRAAVYKRGNKDFTDFIWLDGEVPMFEKESDDKVTTIIKFDSTPRTEESDTPFDNTDRTLKWLFDNPIKEKRYAYMSKKGEFDFNHKISATTVTIYRHESWEEDSEGNMENYDVSYTSGPMKSGSVIANWVIENKVPKYIPVKPLDIRTEKTASGSLIQKYFKGVEFKNVSIDAELRNNKEEDRYAETALPALDTNSANKFTVKFKNNQFGIPDEKNGGYEIYEELPRWVEKKMEQFDPDEDDWDEIQVYYEPELVITSTLDSYNPPRTSLQFEGQEYNGKEEIKKEYGFRGGDFFFRSIKADNYKFGSYEKYPFWMARVKTALYKRYGSRYNGRIFATENGPNFVDAPNGSVPIGGWKRHINFIEARGIQPILYGEFDVKTVGGYRK